MEKYNSLLAFLIIIAEQIGDFKNEDDTIRYCLLTLTDIGLDNLISDLNDILNTEQNMLLNLIQSTPLAFDSKESARSWIERLKKIATNIGPDGIREFNHKFSHFWSRSSKRNKRYAVLSHNRPKSSNAAFGCDEIIDLKENKVVDFDDLATKQAIIYQMAVRGFPTVRYDSENYGYQID